MLENIVFPGFKITCKFHFVIRNNSNSSGRVIQAILSDITSRSLQRAKNFNKKGLTQY